MRTALRDAIPGVQSYFFVGGIVKRILNFGAAAPIDVEIVGYDLEAGSAYARRLLPRLRAINTADGRPSSPTCRSRARRTTPSSTWSWTARRPACWASPSSRWPRRCWRAWWATPSSPRFPSRIPRSGNQYFINVRLADGGRNEVADLKDVLVKAADGTVLPLANVAQVKRSAGPVQVNRKYLQRIVDVTANTGPGVDLGAASAAVEKVLDEVPPPEGFTVQLSGQTAGAARGLREPALRGPHGAGARLHDPRLAVQVAARPAGHHVLACRWASAGSSSRSG